MRSDDTPPAVVRSRVSGGFRDPATATRQGLHGELLRELHRGLHVRPDRPTIATCSSYTDVSRPHVVPTLCTIFPPVINKLIPRSAG